MGRDPPPCPLQPCGPQFLSSLACGIGLKPALRHPLRGPGLQEGAGARPRDPTMHDRSWTQQQANLLGPQSFQPCRWSPRTRRSGCAACPLLEFPVILAPPGSGGVVGGWSPQSFRFLRPLDRKRMPRARGAPGMLEIVVLVADALYYSKVKAGISFSLEELSIHKKMAWTIGISINQRRCNKSSLQ
ncbi:hypothetical protein QTO34_019347 [Cnephaeus nilssonii]|uniref:Large ribosomal subunit protein eL13 n=1 Tax=Cnephaeus nilssonii TaxID=3371016 RepID=A0AA40HXC2_CNENI|nr:hypothetical protein QTO34_019347 [Eptesicus nilssonii]